MISTKHNERRIFLMLAMSLILFCMGFFVSYYHEYSTRPDQMLKKLIRSVQKSRQSLEYDLTDLKKIINTAGNVQDFGLWSAFKRDFLNEGKIFLIYQDDSLILWSDNSFQAENRLTPGSFDKALIVHGNGYYLTKKLEYDSLTLIGLQILKYNYPFNNDYLPDGFFRKFNVHSGIGIALEPGEFNLNDPDGNFLCSLSFESHQRENGYLMLLIFMMYVSSLMIFVYALFLVYFRFYKFIRNRILLLALFVIDVFILRAFLYVFGFPGYLYTTELFSPGIYASSEWLPSLGDLLITVFLVLQLSFIVHRHLRIRKTGNKRKDRTIGVLIILLNLLLYFKMLDQINDLVINSNIPLHFDLFLDLPPLSVVALVIIASVLISYYLITEVSVKLSLHLAGSGKMYLIIATVLLITVFIVKYFFGTADFLPFLFLLLIVYFSVVRELFLNSKKSRPAGIAGILVILALLATFQVNGLISQREHEQRKILTSHLSDTRDKLAEYFFEQAAEEIKKDPRINDIISAEAPDSIIENRLYSYISENYFLKLKSQYNLQLTVCGAAKKLFIRPENIITECSAYFENRIRESLELIGTKGLYLVKQSLDVTYYFGKIDLQSENRKVILYVELESRKANQGQGYPELLVDKSLPGLANISGYSYAMYIQGELVKNVGKYLYDLKDTRSFAGNRNDRFMTYHGFSHYIHSIDDKTLLVVSLENQGLAVRIAPFSFIYFILLSIWLIISVIAGKRVRFTPSGFSFRVRLQLFMVSIILVSSVLIGGVTMIYLKQLNFSKNKDIVGEKMNTIQVELENQFGNSPALDPTMKDNLDDPLLYLSGSNFADINIYDVHGKLIASSRSELFSEGLISDLMNPNSMKNLVNEQKSFFIQEERIGKYKYLSVYAPLRNYENKLIGYLNIPYFARQEELRLELSRLMATYANIYIMIILLAVLVAIMISRYIARPLQLIRNQLGAFSLGESNPRIEWHRTDEIGQLVSAYNQMIDELAVSAELLARSERESAWREMARQVAHEIKNPLTPIKLSMQHLIKAWDDKAPDWESRLKKFSQTLIFQIDTLSAIASEFSDFAQMPRPNLQRIDLISVITNSVQIFKDHENLTIQYPAQFGVYYVYADENQMLRVFNNLIKNSIQAIPQDQHGKIIINLENRQENCLLTFTDNGAGIPVEQQSRIFTPNFTTKSAGMGLGLAMVKNIIDNTGGRIWFESSAGSGTTFHLLIPVTLK